MISDDGLCSMVANDDLLRRAMIAYHRRRSMVADHDTAAVAVTSHRSFVHGNKHQTG